MLNFNKKGQFGDLQNMALGIGVFIIVGVIVASVLSGFGDTLEAGSMASNITTTGLEGVETLVNWTPTLVAIGVGVVILGMVFLFGKGQQR